MKYEKDTLLYNFNVDLIITRVIKKNNSNILKNKPIMSFVLIFYHPYSLAKLILRDQCFLLQVISKALITAYNIKHHRTVH